MLGVGIPPSARMRRSGSLWTAIIGFATLVHVDWHVGRPGDGPLDGDLAYHWVLGLLTGGVLAWWSTRHWPTRDWRVGGTVLIVGTVLGQGVEPLAEVLLSGSWEPLASPIRWRIFGQFVFATTATFVALRGLQRISSGPPRA